MPVLTEDDPGQEHHEASEKRAQRVAETHLHSFVHDLFSDWFVLCAAESDLMGDSAESTALMWVEEVGGRQRLADLH